jgi:hypothetical protein
MPDEPTPPADPEPEAPPPEPDPAADTDEPLGEGGKRALTAERTARKAAEDREKALQAQLEELQQAQMSEQEKAVAEARRAGETEATAKVQRRIFTAEAKVAASGKVQDPTLFADPDVALKLLGFNEVPVDAAGDIDSEAISKAIDKLTQDRPYLAANGAKPSPGSADGGPRGSGAPTQLTRDDLKSMSPKDITKAKAEGRLRDVLSGKA